MLVLLSRELSLARGGLTPYRHWSSLGGAAQWCLALVLGRDPGSRGRWSPGRGVVRPGRAIIEMYWSWDWGARAGYRGLGRLPVWLYAG